MEDYKDTIVIFGIIIIVAIIIISIIGVCSYIQAKLELNITKQKIEYLKEQELLDEETFKVMLQDIKL